MRIKCKYCKKEFEYEECFTHTCEKCNDDFCLDCGDKLGIQYSLDTEKIICKECSCESNKNEIMKKAKKQYLEIAKKIAENKGSFEELYKNLKGHNYCEDKDINLFDVELDNIIVTIEQDKHNRRLHKLIKLH